MNLLIEAVVVAGPFQCILQKMPLCKKQIKWKENQNKKGVIFISISFGYAYEKNLRYYEHI